LIRNSITHLRKAPFFGGVTTNLIGGVQAPLQEATVGVLDLVREAAYTLDQVPCGRKFRPDPSYSCWYRADSFFSQFFEFTDLAVWYLKRILKRVNPELLRDLSMRASTPLYSIVVQIENLDFQTAKIFS